MIFKQELEYHEPYIPHRCRKPRERTLHEVFQGMLLEVTSAQAPVAIIQHEKCSLDHHEHVGLRKGNTSRIEYHWFDKRLFARVRLSRFLCGSLLKRDRQATVKDIHYSGPSDYTERTRGGVEAGLKKWLAGFLIVDGKLCIQMGEPRYVVNTFGLGNNHGGTGLFAENHYNSNIPWTNYFRCDKMQDAMEFHDFVALGRGDNESVPSKLHPTFEILIPEAVQLDPSAWGGEGDPFINRCEKMITATADTGSRMMAGLLVMREALTPTG